MSGAILLLLLYASMAWTGNILSFLPFYMNIMILASFLANSHEILGNYARSLYKFNLQKSQHL
jgi:hypothetical protein